MSRLWAVIPLLAVLCRAQSGITPPRVGYLLDRAGTLRPLFGLAGSFVLGQPVSSGVLSAAGNGRYTFLKTEDAILVVDEDGRTLDRRQAAGNALIAAFSPGASQTILILPDSGEMYCWQQGAWRSLPVSWPSREGEVLAATQAVRGRLSLVVRRESTFWQLEMALTSGRLAGQRPLAGVAPPLLLASDGTLLFASGNDLVARRPGGLERRVALDAPPLRLAALGDGWIHVESGLANLALRLLETGEELYRLPEAAP